MSEPAWLKRYFSAEHLKSLKPKIVLEGKTHAVLRLHGGGAAYIGVWKGGQHNVSRNVPLLEHGPDSATKFHDFRQWLKTVDGSFGV